MDANQARTDKLLVQHFCKSNVRTELHYPAKTAENNETLFAKGEYSSHAQVRERIPTARCNT